MFKKIKPYTIGNHPLTYPPVGGLIWKEIPNFSNYEVSELGHVRRALNEPIGRCWEKYRRGALLEVTIKDNEDAYLCYHMYNDQGVGRMHRIHQIVALAFHGTKPHPNFCALHCDDDRYDNHYTNIYWGSKRDNAIDRSINNKCGNAKLTSDQVRSIRLMRQDNIQQKEIAKTFNISQETVSAILRGKNYSWVK